MELKLLARFFNFKNIDKLKFYKKTKIIYAPNVFCHTKDLNDVIKCVDYLLSSVILFRTLSRFNVRKYLI